MPRYGNRRCVYESCRVVVAVFVVGVQPLAAQAAYTSANAQTSIVPLHYGFLSGDFAEAKLAVTFIAKKDLSCAGDDCVPDQLNFALNASAAVEKGQETMFSRLGFNPGFDLGGRLVYVVQRAGPGYDAFFLGVRYTTQERDIIERDPLIGITTLDEISQRTFAASAGFNHAFSEMTILGVGLEGRRELSSPGVQLATERCTPGTSFGGGRVLVCADRFDGPLLDLWSGHARADLMIRIVDLGSTTAAARLGLTTAVSVDISQNAGNAVNFAFGPSVHVPGYPGHTVAALLFGLRDAFDANELLPDYGRFVVRLVFSVPFEILVGN